MENGETSAFQVRCHSLNLLENSMYSGSAFACLGSRRLGFVVSVVSTPNQTN